MFAGYAKKINARATSAGLRKFIPVPPKTSLLKMIEKTHATATIHSGISGGNINGINIAVTNAPSFNGMSINLGGNKLHS